MCGVLSEPIGLSGQGIRFITHVVAHDCMHLDSENTAIFSTHTPPFDPPDMAIINAARKSILLINYANAGEGHMQVEVINLSEFDERTASQLSKRVPGPGLKWSNAWHAAWAHTPLGFSECLLYVIPVIIVLPRDIDAPQVMTALCTLHRTLPSTVQRKGLSRNGEPHVRWLHRM